MPGGFCQAAKKSGPKNEVTASLGGGGGGRKVGFRCKRVLSVQTKNYKLNT